MAKQKDKQFKLDAVKYREEHKDLSVEECSRNLGKRNRYKSSIYKELDIFEKGLSF